MISISQPEHFYQVRSTFPPISQFLNKTLQIFLPQGLGLGVATGIMYIPAIGVVSHYFQKRRALAIGIATSVSGLWIPLSELKSMIKCVYLT